MDPKRLLMDLLKADTESEVVRLLNAYGLWSDDSAWRYYGDDPGNYRIGGNQSGRPEPALVEKLVNSVDAMLLRHCLERGIDPRSEVAPRTMREAVARFYEGGRTGSYHGDFGNWTEAEVRAVARDITVALTGETPRAAGRGRGFPSITIADRGEGQSPDRIPHTILSLGKGLKSEVPFVQGKFNMGGTSALRFAGEQNLQLVVSKRSPAIAAQEGASSDWGFTVVRLETPKDARMSTYRYLAPVGSADSPQNGGLLRVTDQTLPIFPAGNEAYVTESEWGTLIKLYEYQTRFRTSFFMNDGLLGPLDVFLPGLPLPIRLHECRGFRGHAGSWETTLTGLQERLRKAELDIGPLSNIFEVDGHPFRYTIYCTTRRKARDYRGDDAIIFTVNGQTHATLSERFFRRSKVSMGPLQKDLVVILDCSALDTRSMERLFLNSRDRLADSELRRRIESQLETVLGTHEGLRQLRERRLREELEERIGNQRPLEDALRSILEKSPLLSRLFVAGTRLSNPFNTGPREGGGEFEGKPFPTFFRFRRVPYGEEYKRDWHLGERARLDFETDAEDGYFEREVDAGVLSLSATLRSERVRLDWASTLYGGSAHVLLTLPESSLAGDTIEIEITVNDPRRTEPFVNTAVLSVRPAQIHTSGPTHPRAPKGKGDILQDQTAGIQFPDVIGVRSKDWAAHDMDEFSAVRIDRQDADGPFVFFVNMDNQFLRFENKSRPDQVGLNEAKFSTGMVLLGLGIVRQFATPADRSHPIILGDADQIQVEDVVAFSSDAFAPMLLPSIEALSGIDPEIVLFDERIAGEAETADV